MQFFDESRMLLIAFALMGISTIALFFWFKQRISLIENKLENENVVTEDQFIVQKAALTGFTHHRYDWLDNGKYIWY